MLLIRCKRIKSSTRLSYIVIGKLSILVHLLSILLLFSQEVGSLFFIKNLGATYSSKYKIV